jgi:hypothetical protein
MPNPKDEQPFELAPQTTPRVRAEWGRVIVALELKSLSDPLDVRDIEIALSGQYAATLGAELISSAQKVA